MYSYSCVVAYRPQMDPSAILGPAGWSSGTPCVINEHVS